MLREVKFHNAIKLSTAKVTNSIKMAVINTIGYFLLDTTFNIFHIKNENKFQKCSHLKMTVLVVNVNILCKVSFERDPILNLINERIYLYKYTYYI